MGPLVNFSQDGLADGVGQDRVQDGVGVLQQLRHAAEGRALDEMPPEHCPAVAAVRPPTQIFVRHFFFNGCGSFPEFGFVNNSAIFQKNAK